MEKILKSFEGKMFPIAMKVGNNKILISIREGLMLAIPLIVVGSLLLLIVNFPNEKWIEFLNSIGISQYLLKGIDSSFGLLGLVASFGVAYSLANRYKLDGVMVGIISLVSFITVTPFVGDGAEKGIQLSYIDSRGLFVAMIIAIISTYMFRYLINRNVKIKLPKMVPLTIEKSFSAVIPATIIIILWLAVFAILEVIGAINIYEVITNILEIPFNILGSNVIVVIIAITMNGLFWMFGIHGGNIVDTIMIPIWAMNSYFNRLAFQADAAAELPNIITVQFIQNFVFIGGSGATIGLAIVITIISRRKNVSKTTKSIAPLTLVPSLFNINEPIIFGAPVVMNPMLLIPFILAPIANLIICYIAMSTGLVAKTTGIAVSWTMPPIISGFLSTGSISGVILQIVCIIVDVIIYYKFYELVERRNLELESSREALNEVL